MRCTARAVKAAQFAFTGAERTAFTEQAGGEAHSYGRKGRRKSESPSFPAACCDGQIHDDLPLVRENLRHSRRTKSELSRTPKYVSSGYGRYLPRFASVWGTLT
jgi:hypothetical protein